MIKTCKICSNKFDFNEEEHILSTTDSYLDKGHYTALFPDICQRCNALIVQLDVENSFSNPISALQKIQEFEKYSNSMKETIQFITFMCENF